MSLCSYFVSRLPYTISGPKINGIWANSSVSRCLSPTIISTSVLFFLSFPVGYSNQYIESCVTSISSLTITAISFERFIAICEPFKVERSLGRPPRHALVFFLSSRFVISSTRRQRWWQSVSFGPSVWFYRFRSWSSLISTRHSIRLIRLGTLRIWSLCARWTPTQRQPVPILPGSSSF